MGLEQWFSTYRLGLARVVASKSYRKFIFKIHFKYKCPLHDGVPRIKFTPTPFEIAIALNNI